MKKNKKLIRASNTILAIVLLFTSLITLSGCKKKVTEKKEEQQTEEVTPLVEKTPEELEAEALQDFQSIPDGKTHNNEVLERYNKIQAYRYIVNPGHDQSEVIELIPPTKEGLAELQKNGRIHQFIESVIIPCCFVFYTKDDGWIKTHPGKMWDTRRDFYVVSDEKYKYISDDELDKRFKNKEPGRNYQLGDEKDEN